MQNNFSFDRHCQIIIHTPHAGTFLPLHFSVPRHGDAIRHNNFMREFIRPFYEQLTDHYTDKLFNAVAVGPYTKPGERIIQYCECDAFKYADKDYVNTFLNYHSLMIEVNKHCYMNEDTLELTDGYYKLHRELQELYAALLKG